MEKQHFFPGGQRIEMYFDENTNTGIDAVQLVLFDEMTWTAFEKEWERRYKI